MSAAKKKPVDLAIVFGGSPKKVRHEDAEKDDDSYDDDDDTGDVPAAFESAYDEWEESPGPKTMWAMIKACVGEDY
jgi:hypothetical protein